MARKKRAAAPTEKNEMAFAVEVARGASIAQAAKTVGVSEGTGYRWARKPEVRKSVDDIRSAVLHAASNRITCLATKAVDTLGRLLDSESEQIQLSAARAVLDGTVKMREMAELEMELEQIQGIVATIRESNSYPNLNHA
jgi:transposase